MVMGKIKLEYIFLNNRRVDRRAEVGAWSKMTKKDSDYFIKIILNLLGNSTEFYIQVDIDIRIFNR